MIRGPKKRGAYEIKYIYLDRKFSWTQVIKPEMNAPTCIKPLYSTIKSNDPMWARLCRNDRPAFYQLLHTMFDYKPNGMTTSLAALPK